MYRWAWCGYTISFPRAQNTVFQAQTHPSSGCLFASSSLGLLPLLGHKKIWVKNYSIVQTNVHKNKVFSVTKQSKFCVLVFANDGSSKKIHMQTVNPSKTRSWKRGNHWNFFLPSLEPNDSSLSSDEMQFLWSKSGWWSLARLSFEV